MLEIVDAKFSFPAEVVEGERWQALWISLLTTGNWESVQCALQEKVDKREVTITTFPVSRVIYYKTTL